VAGCYQYSTLSSPSPDAGTSVRIDLTDAGSAQLAPTIGQRVESIDAQSVSTSDSTLAVSVLATISTTGVVAHWNKERVDIPRSAISRVRGRRLDAKRSYLAAALAVIGAVAMGEAFGLDLGFGSRRGNTPGTKQ
jgi:hypothetical protein